MENQVLRIILFKVLHTLHTGTGSNIYFSVAEKDFPTVCINHRSSNKVMLKNLQNNFCSDD